MKREPILFDSYGHVSTETEHAKYFKHALSRWTSRALEKKDKEKKTPIYLCA